jgi:hypothetical protein
MTSPAPLPAPAHGVCDYCVRTKALNASGVVGLHFLPDTNKHTSRVRRRCPGSFRAPREARR